MRLKNGVLLGLVFFLFLFVPIQSTAEEPQSMTCSMQTIDNEPVVYCYEFKSEYNSTLPIIKVNFNDHVVVNKTKLIKVGSLDDPVPSYQEMIQLDLEQYGDGREIESVGDNKYQPLSLLSDGGYVFIIQGYNPREVLIDIRVFFKTNASAMNFWVHEPVHVSGIEKPDFAVSRTQIGTLMIQTERPAEGCVFSKSPLPSGDEEFVYYQLLPNFNFTRVEDNNTLLFIEDFNFGDGQTINDYYALRWLRVICKEESDGGGAGASRYSYGDIYFGWLNQPPGVNAQPYPLELVDWKFLDATMNITSNHAVGCVMSTEQPPQGSKPLIPYEPGTIFNSMFDFRKNQIHNLTFFPNPTEHDFEFNITCKNLAGFQTTVFETISVNFQDSVEFLFDKPTQYVNTDSIIVEGRAPAINPDTDCFVSFEEDGSFNEFMLDNKGDIGGVITYEGSFSPDIDQGDNEVFVQCVGIDTIFSKEFVFDTVPPSEPNISTTAEGHTCSLSGIDAVFEASDATSGIHYYEYEIEPVSSEFEDLLYINDESSSGVISINKDLSFLDQEEIRIRARAFDRAGNEGPWNSKVLTVSNSSLVICDVTPPSITIESSFIEVSNNWLVNVSCEDDHSGCKQSFKWGLNTNLSGTCNATHPHTLGELVTVNQPGIFCAKVFDFNNNEAYDSIIINRTYDSDCGDICGVEGCPGCGLGDPCEEDDQCDSKYCLNGFCAQPTCTDGIHNGYETDIDCGGPCPPCGLGKMCDNHADCESKSCEEGVCVEATCEDGRQSGTQTGVDCGGEKCPPCPLGEGCIEDSDCKEGLCINNICAIPSDDPETTDRDDEESTTSILGLIFLILGILAIGTGAALLYFESEKKKKVVAETSFRPGASLNKGVPRVSALSKNNKMPQIKTLSPAEMANRKKAWSESLKQKEKERKKILSTFGAKEEFEKILSKDSNKQYSDEKNVNKNNINNVPDNEKVLVKDKLADNSEEKPKHKSVGEAGQTSGDEMKKKSEEKSEGKLEDKSEEKSQDKKEKKKPSEAVAKTEDGYIEIDDLKKQKDSNTSKISDEKDKKDSDEDFFKKLKEMSEKNKKRKQGK